MSTPEEKERRRRRMKRSMVVRDLHSNKYRQRIVRSKRRSHNIKDDPLDDLEFEYDVVDDDCSNDLSFIGEDDVKKD